MDEYIFIALMPLSLTVALLIETTSWSLRGSANTHNKGLFISRTNIYLYSARLFILFYAVGLSFLVDKNAPLTEIIKLILGSYLLAAVFHLFLLHKKIHDVLCKFFLKLLVLNEESIKNTGSKCDVFVNRLFLHTTFSAFVFCCAMVTPYVAASLLPDYRMTLSALGQIVNALGTLALLFFVDPILYKLMDLNVLAESLRAYYVGRIIGFMMGSLIAALLGFLML
jgi:hypothetical protein